jgi:hypothetical protein
MPPKGWKKGYNTNIKAKQPKPEPKPEEPEPAPPVLGVLYGVTIKDVQPLPKPDRLKELLRGIPDDQFMLMVSNSGMDRDRVRELCDLFRKLKA